MAEREYLGLLASTTPGKLICLNIDRAMAAGLIGEDAFRAFLRQCSSNFDSEAPKHPGEVPSTIALAAARTWGARALASRSSRRAVDPEYMDQAGVSTVSHLWAVVREFNEEAGATYFDRCTRSSDDFSELVRTLVRGRRSWHFGKGRDYCWVASVLDASTKVSSRTGLPAQLHRDLLGLCHFGHDDILVRLAMTSKAMTRVPRFYRPMVFDGADNPAFRATCDDETTSHQHPYGMTVDLHKLDARESDVNGTREWLCAPADVPAEEITWDFLGAPHSKSTRDDPLMHRRMYRALGGRPALLSALDRLRTALGR